MRGKDFYQLNGDEKLAEMAKYRESGNCLFKAGPAFLGRAIKRYEEAIRKAPGEQDFKSLGLDEKEAKLKAVQQQTLTCHLNVAAALLKIGKVKEALKHCNDAVKIDPINVKALYRRGQTRAALEDLDGAKSDLLEAAKRDPQNRDVRKELEKLKVQSAARKAELKAQFGGMFS